MASRSFAQLSKMKRRKCSRGRDQPFGKGFRLRE
jgi:hypothetical protein